MYVFIENILILHVFWGLLGIGFAIAVFVGLSKKELNFNFLKISSLFSFLSFLVSWGFGGFYYVDFYGENVKPGIKGGDFAWMHSIIMETKEHVFLFIPFLALVVFLAIWLNSDSMNEKPKLKKIISRLTLLIVLLGVAIAVMGAAISGSVRQ